MGVKTTELKRVVKNRASHIKKIDSTIKFVKEFTDTSIVAFNYKKRMDKSWLQKMGFFQ